MEYFRGATAGCSTGGCNVNIGYGGIGNKMEFR